MPCAIAYYFLLSQHVFEARWEIQERTGIPLGTLSRLVKVWLERDMLEVGPKTNGQDGRRRDTFRRRFSSITFTADGTEVAV